MSKPQYTHYAITGIQVGLDPKDPLEPKPLRQEVDAWLLDDKNKKQINLFFVALDDFQKMPITDTLSYWQVAGIHGQPLVPWDEKTESETFGVGYCFHNSLLFASWHRLYMLLFEQRIHELMLKRANEFPSAERDDWVAAANAWRLPYWDWAEKKSRSVIFPDVKVYDAPLIVKQDVVKVEVGQGEDAPLIKDIPNPMAAFRTPDGQRMGSAAYGRLGLQPVTYCKENGKCETHYFNICRATSRHPPEYDPKNMETVNAWGSGVQNNEAIGRALETCDWDENHPDYTYSDHLGEAVYHLFGDKHFKSYAAFASTRYIEQKDLPAGEFLSLENIHNNIHDWTGGATNGHMSWVPVAAFDPIFYIHHANIDRLLAIWQELNGDLWFSKPEEQLTEPSGNWSVPKGGANTPQTPLAPFRGADGAYHTSDGLRYWSEGGYTYPELQPWEFLDDQGALDKERYHKAIRERLSDLYATNSKIALSKADDPEAVGWTILTDEAGRHYVGAYDYIVNVWYERFALNGRPFSVHITLANKYHAGSIYNFCTPAEATGGNPLGCENCRQQELEGALQKGQINLTNALMRAADDGVEALRGDNLAEAEEWIQHNIQLRVIATGYEEIPLADIPSCKAYIARAETRHFRDHTVLSSYNDYEILDSATKHQSWGMVPAAAH